MGLCQAVFVHCKISSGHKLNCPGLMAESMDLRKSFQLSMLKVSILTPKLAQFRILSWILLDHNGSYA